MGSVGEAIMRMGSSYRKSSGLSDKQNTLASPSFSLGERDPWDHTSSSLPLLTCPRVSGSEQSFSCLRRGRRILYIGCRSQTSQSRRHVDRGRRRWGWASCLRPYILVPFVTGGGPRPGSKLSRDLSLLGRGKIGKPQSTRLEPARGARRLRNHTFKVVIRRNLAIAAALNKVIGA